MVNNIEATPILALDEDGEGKVNGLFELWNW